MAAVRILHLVDRWTDRGGAYRFLLDAIAALRRAGHEVGVAAGTREMEPDPELRLVPGLSSRIHATVDLDQLAEHWRPDVVHVHTVLNPAALEWAALRPAVMTVQDHRWFCPTRGKWTLDGRECREPMAPGSCAACFEDADYFRHVHALTEERLAAVRRMPLTTLSRYMARELEAAGVPAERLTVIPPALAATGTRPAPAHGHVGLVGRLSDAKGVRDAVAAWRRSGTERPLLAAGTGPLRPWLESQGVLVTGWLDRPRLADFRSRTRALLLLPRWQEPFGMAGLEALAEGVPVVAWESGGISEWHPGPLVAWGDVEGAAAALRATLQGGPVPEPARASLRRRFGVTALVDSLLRVYRRALGLP
jgi:glycosyltransferase involved in cell wall biosynthesis